MPPYTESSAYRSWDFYPDQHTASQHNAHQLPGILRLAQSLKVDAFHLFLLVPVGCGFDHRGGPVHTRPESERILNWFYDRSLDSGLELKATCAPHYYRIVRQRRADARRLGMEVPSCRREA
jgi:MoaA/NifB/PqqE/SkfB family radical SAM enzyme